MAITQPGASATSTSTPTVVTATSAYEPEAQNLPVRAANQRAAKQQGFTRRQAWFDSVLVANIL